MPEDKKLAHEQAEADLRSGLNRMKQIAERDHVPLDVFGADKLPDTGSDDAGFIVFTMGMRDELTKREADRLARAWCETSKRFPNSQFYLQVAGYDNDPRELWEFPEVTHYVRRFARTAGLDSEEAVTKWLEPIGTGFLAACGVFGEEARQATLRNAPPRTKPQ
jgi:hypothetical protein